MQRIVEVIYAITGDAGSALIATALKPILTDYVNTGSGPLKSFVSVLGPNLISMFIAFGMLYWVTMSRIIRGGQVLLVPKREYVTAARALVLPVSGSFYDI